MSLQYNKINVSLNGTKILCDSINLSQQGNQKPQFAINYSGPFNYTPESIKNTLTLNYYMEVSGEPNFNIISGLKSSFLTGNSQTIINIGESIFTGYLNKFSFSIAPLQTLKAQASYEVFGPLINNFIPNNTSDGNLYNLTNSSGILNYFSVFLLSGGNQILNSNVLQIDYVFTCNIYPVYSLTNLYPVQIYVSDASEQLNTISEIQNNVTFSGQNLISLLGVDSILLTNISNTWGDNLNKLIITISGMNHISEKTDINTSNIILFQDQWQQSF